MKRYVLFALYAILSIGCEQSQTIEENGCGDAIVTTDALTQPGDIILVEPSVIRFDGPRFYDGVCLGPLLVDLAKWGPSPLVPLAWPSLLSQLGEIDPQSPSDALVYEAKVPPDASLAGVTAWAHPATMHMNIPENRPTMDVILYEPNMGEPKILASTTHNADTLAAYEKRVQLFVNIEPPARVPAGTRVFVHVIGESGPNARMGLAVDTPQFLFVADRMAMP